MILTHRISEAVGLGEKERHQIDDLIECFNYHQSKNIEKERYYEGHVTLGEVNLGIALPEGLRSLELGCEWGAKTVDVLASRSMFDGFVGQNGREAETMTKIMDANRLKSEYAKACRDELKFGATYATLSADPEIGCSIKFHSAKTAAAKWNGEKGRIDYGLAVIDTDRDPKSVTKNEPTVVNLYTDSSIWVIRRIEKERWEAQEHPHRMGRPLMEPLIWNATSAKPFGRSRLKKPIREMIKGYVRTIANATIGLEFATSPQKYLLGITDEQYDKVVNQKFRTYVGSLLASTNNPETGEKPSFGQLSQGTLEPHVQMIRLLATQFSAATGLTVTDTGVINDANPTSYEAIVAQSQTLILMAEQLNAGNGESLRTIAMMAQAIAGKKALKDLTDDERAVVAYFKNPAMPSVGVTADAAIKIASVRTEFASTDTFLEMIGFDQADVRRIKAQEQRVRGQKILTEEFADADIEEGLGEIR